jgi:hypothetical protein
MDSPDQEAAMFDRTPSTSTRHRLLIEIRDAVFLLAIVALPGLAVYQAAQEANVVRIVSGDSVTISGTTPAGTRISLTSYQASPDPALPCPAASPEPLVATAESQRAASPWAGNTARMSFRIACERRWP